jgi:hypothetical protein
MSDEVEVSRKEFRLQERTFFGVKHYRIHDVSKGEYVTLPNDGSDWLKLWIEAGGYRVKKTPKSNK